MGSNPNAPLRSGESPAELALVEQSGQIVMRLFTDRANVIGTADDSTINVSQHPYGPYVSPRHALIVRRDDGRWVIYDRDASTNGTFVNGERLGMMSATRQLMPGDEIRIGFGIKFTVKAAD